MHNLYNSEDELSFTGIVENTIGSTIDDYVDLGCENGKIVYQKALTIFIQEATKLLKNCIEG